MFCPAAIANRNDVMEIPPPRAGQLRFRWLILLITMLMQAGFATHVSAQVTHSFTEPVEQSQVAAAEPGVIAVVLVREGERVRVGQPLAELEHAVLDRTLQIAQLRADSDANVRATQATLQIRQRKYDNLQPLLAAGHTNPAEVDQAKAEFDAALAEYELAVQQADENRLDVSRIEAEISRRIIYSPIDGLVTSIHRQPGEYIATTEPRFATVVRLDQLRVRFYLSAATAEQLAGDQLVSLELPGETPQPLQARIEFVSPVTDPESGTARVDVLINNQHGQWRSGTPCRWIGPETSTAGVQP